MPARRSTHVRKHMVVDGKLIATKDIQAFEVVLKEEPLEVHCADELSAGDFARMDHSSEYAAMYSGARLYFQRFEDSSKLVQSCLPNVVDQGSNTEDSRFAFRPKQARTLMALQHIRKGDVLTTAHGGRAVDVPFAARQAALSTTSTPGCACMACVDADTRALYDQIAALQQGAKPTQEGLSCQSMHNHARRIAMYEKQLQLLQQVNAPPDTIMGRAEKAFALACGRRASLSKCSAFVDILRAAAEQAGQRKTESLQSVELFSAQLQLLLTDANRICMISSIEKLQKWVMAYNQQAAAPLPLLWDEDVLPAVEERFMPGTGASRLGLAAAATVACHRRSKIAML